MKTKLEEFADTVALMELCAQLEAEHEKIFAALPALKDSVEKGAREQYDKLTARAETIEQRIGWIAEQYSLTSEATKAEFARLEKSINAKGKELADYSKRVETIIPKPVEEKIKALFATLPVPKDGQPGVNGKDASLLTGFRGNWSEDFQYKAGEWFTFRGSSYLVLQACKGQIPTKITQTGKNPCYAVFAMSGAPGLPPVGVGGNVTGPASATDNAIALFNGTTGQALKNSDLTYSGTTLTVPDAFSLTSAGSIDLAAGGTNQSITITPSGTGGVNTSGNLTTTRTGAVDTAFAIVADSGQNKSFNFRSGANRVFAFVSTTTDLFRITAYNPSTDSAIDNPFTVVNASGGDITLGGTTGRIVNVSSGLIRGGAGNMTITAGTGASRTMALQTTTSGSTATTWVSANATQQASFTSQVAVNGATASTTTGLITSAGTTGVSSLRIPHGEAPSSPVDGDMWTTTAGLFVRINGATVGPLS